MADGVEVSGSGSTSQSCLLIPPTSPPPPYDLIHDQQQQQQQHYVKKKKSLFRRLLVEMIAFLGTSGIAVRTITQQQLLQDKLCVQEFGCSSQYCRDLNHQPDSVLKDDILTQFSALLTLKELTILVPHILTVLLIGSWCDRYPNGRWFCMIAGAASLLLEILLMLLNAVFFDWSYALVILSHLPSSFFGSNLALLIVLYSYIVAHCPADERTLRLVVINVIQYVATAGATFTGSLILQSRILLLTDQVRNYAAVFLLAFALITVMLVMVLLCMKEDPVDHNHNTWDSERRSLITQSAFGRDREKQAALIIDRNNVSTPSSAASGSVFGLSNLYEIVHALLRPRKGNQRKVLILVIGCMMPIAAAFHGKEAVVFAVVQKMYQWDNMQYATAATFGSLIHPLLTMVSMPLLFSCLHASDLQVSIMGATSYYVGNVFLGSFGSWSPLAFYVSMILTALSGLVGQGVRAHVSRIASQQEVGKLFSLIAMLEAVMPFVGSAVLTAVLADSISSFPTLVFHVVAFWVLIGIAILAYVDLI